VAVLIQEGHVETVVGDSTRLPAGVAGGEFGDVALGLGDGRVDSWPRWLGKLDLEDDAADTSVRAAPHKLLVQDNLDAPLGDAIVTEELIEGLDEVLTEGGLLAYLGSPTLERCQTSGERW